MDTGNSVTQMMVLYCKVGEAIENTDYPTAIVLLEELKNLCQDEKQVRTLIEYLYRQAEKLLQAYQDEVALSFTTMAKAICYQKEFSDKLPAIYALHGRALTQNDQNSEALSSRIDQSSAAVIADLRLCLGLKRSPT